MVLADAKDIETDLVGVFDLFEQITHAGGRTEGDTCSRVWKYRCEAVNADLHECFKAKNCFFATRSDETSMGACALFAAILLRAESLKDRSGHSHLAFFAHDVVSSWKSLVCARRSSTEL